jgi:hypothetical protein
MTQDVTRQVAQDVTPAQAPGQTPAATRPRSRPVRWAEVRLVAAREVGEKLRSRTFLISSAFFLVIVVASIALPALLSDDGPPTYAIAAVGAPAVALTEQVPADQVELTLREASDTAAAERLLEAEEVEAVLEVSADGRSSPGCARCPATSRRAGRHLPAGQLQTRSSSRRLRGAGRRTPLGPDGHRAAARRQARWLPS